MTAITSIKDYRRWRQEVGPSEAIRRLESVLAMEPKASWAVLADAMLTEQASPEAATLLGKGGAAPADPHGHLRETGSGS